LWNGIKAAFASFRKKARESDCQRHETIYRLEFQQEGGLRCLEQLDLRTLLMLPMRLMLPMPRK
jgi:hypothetical protein